MTEAPDHDTAGKGFDKAVQPETDQCNTTGTHTGRNRKEPLKDIISHGNIGESKGPFVELITQNIFYPSLRGVP